MRHLKKNLISLGAMLLISASVFSQTLYVPGGTAGIGTSSVAGNVGIGADPGSYQFAIRNNANTFNFLVYGADGNGNTYGGHLFRIISKTGENFSVNAFNASTGKLTTDLGVNYTVSGANSTNTWATNGAKYAPFIRFDAETGTIQLYGESGPLGAAGSSYRYPNSNLGIWVGSNGNVGIGKPSTSQRLEVDGTVKATSFVTTDGSSIEAWSTATGGINYAGGNVGIGTNTPGYKLDVNGDINAQGTINVTGPGTAQDIYYRMNGRAAFAFFNSGNSASSLLTINREFINPTGYRSNFSNVAIYGNVGIGTDHPDYALDVIGTIRAQEILCNTDGADFVFGKNYKLPSLNEVESFIKENNHLPGVRPAADMQKNGVALSEMNTVLLQKVEELTLYVIELQKQVNDLKSTNK